MLKVTVFSAALFVAATAAPTLVLAASATVQIDQGRVLIDHGSGFQPAQGAVQAAAGTRVMASPDGAARVIYADGCAVNVRPGSIVSVGVKSPCTAASLAGLEPVETPPPQAGWGAVPLLLGVTGAAVAYCISGPCNDDNGGGHPPPASP
jgi:hypothetical protein